MTSKIVYSATLCFALAVHADDLKLRGGYISIANNRAILAKMHAAGMNAVWPKMGSFAASDEDTNAVRQLSDWAAACEKNSIQLWPVVNFAGGGPELDAVPDYRHEVTAKGRTMRRTPCPRDERFWRQAIFPRFLKVAAFAKEHPIICGMILDTEMYGADHTSYSLCYCDDCKRGAGDTNAVAIAAFIGRDVERICRDLERQVHAINPQFRFGVLHLDLPGKWYEGIARGLGTKELPVVCGSEMTYSSGFTPYIDQTRARFSRIGASVSFVSGLWTRQFPTENIAEQLYALGRRAGGYWIYTMQSLDAPSEKQSDGYRLAEPQERYWAAIKQADDELDKFAASGGSYESALKIRPWKVPQQPIAKDAFEKRRLVPLAEAKPSLPLPGDETRLRDRNFILINAAAGESLRFTIRGWKIGRNLVTPAFAVLDPDGNELLKGGIELGATREVEVAVKSTGTHTLITEAGSNACSVTVANPHVVYAATKRHPLRLITKVRRLYFNVPANTAARVELHTDGDGEAVLAKLLNPSGEIAAQKVIVGDDYLSATGPAGAWSVTFEKTPESVMEDIHLYLPPPLQPYLADAPERLMMDGKR